ncbi:hypothetical protein NQ315_015628 [Exocentrus adspersus]|uniref:Uncharacterized protein n=1 Tax=Exocentrus adspersus TaxID=1586481 RepID=A0AAV8W2I0_9CUCU|nr:hypothetical protein NQ315_015628 [Exocentrus adspersus]
MKNRKNSSISQKLLPLGSHVVLAAVNLYCLIIYFTQVTDKNLLDFGYVAYITMLAQALIGLTKYLNDESFIDLRILLEYGQIVLPHPFLTTALWQKLSVGPNEIALLHCFFGLAAFLFFILMEYKRQDLTDLALITSITSSIIVGILYENYFATASGFLMAGSYFKLKRGEDVCTASPKTPTFAYYNLTMAAFSGVTLAQFEPKNWIPEF